MRTIFIAVMVLWASHGNALTFRYTVPSTNADVVDSTYFHCTGSAQTRDLNRTKLWWWPSSGGMARIIMDRNVRFKEGLPDSFTTPDSVATIGGHFWITASDTANNVSCPSNVVYVGAITAVDPFGSDVTVFEPDPVERTMVFDVHGRLVHSPMASGIYFIVNVHRSGRMSSAGRRLYLR